MKDLRGDSHSMIPFLPLLFLLALPFIEIALFIDIGQEIGVFATLLLCVAAAVFGIIIVKLQGLAIFHNSMALLERGKLPVREVFDGLCLAVAGVLLLIPGFFSDALGFALLIPAIRRYLRGFLTRHYGFADVLDPSRQEGDVVDVEFSRVEAKRLSGQPDKDL